MNVLPEAARRDTEQFGRQSDPGPPYTTASRRTARRMSALWLLVPLLIHLALQGAYAFLDRAPDFDESIYLDLGRNIVRTGWVTSSAYPPKPFLIHPPLFYYLVGTSFALFGPGLEAGRIVSTLFSLGTLVLVFRMLRRSLGDRWAAAGTLLVAVNPAFLYYGHSVYMETTVTFWLTAALWAFARAGEDRGLRWEAWTGVFLALACVTKYYAAILVAVLALMLLARRGGTRRARRLLALLGPVVLASLVWIGFGAALGGKSFLVAQVSWGQPDLAGANFSWRQVSNGVFLKELAGVLTPTFSGLALLALGAALARQLLRRPREVHELALWYFCATYLLFLLSFREKDVKYVLPVIPALALLIALAPPVDWVRRLPVWSKWGAVLGLAAMGSPLLPLYDPLTGQRHDNLWVFGVRRDAEYRLYREAGVLAGRLSAPGQILVCQRKGPIIGYYADRPYLDLYGSSPEQFQEYLQQAEVVVLDRNTEYLSRERWESERAFVNRQFQRIRALPGPEDPVLEVYVRLKSAPNGGERRPVEVLPGVAEYEPGARLSSSGTTGPVHRLHPGDLLPD